MKYGLTNTEAIEAIRKNYPPENYSILREALDMAIQALETIEKGVVPVDWHNDVYETIQKRYIDLLERTRWIPVSERLPTKNDADRLGRVLSYNSYMDWVDTFSWHGVEHSDSVTHWMPLPEPPQEVE